MMNTFCKRFKQYRNMYENLLILLFLSLCRVITFNTVLPSSFLSLYILMAVQESECQCLNLIW